VTARLRGKNPDYWDHATLLELSILGSQHDTAQRAPADALATVREAWEPETTGDSLAIIEEGRASRGEDVQWIEAIKAALRAEGRPAAKANLAVIEDGRACR